MSQKEYPDVIFATHALENGMFNIYPVDTKVMNVGFDGSGIHCTNNSRFFFHDTFHNTEKTSFVLNIDREIDEHYVSQNAQYVRIAFGHNVRRSLYSYLLYVLCLTVGRERTIRLRDSAKTGLQKLRTCFFKA